MFSEASVIHNAAIVPNIARIAPKTIATGSLNERNSISNTVKTRKMAASKTNTRLRKEACCCS